jgi:hypothetical protein
MMRHACMILLTIPMLLATMPQVRAGEDEDATIEIMTAAVGEVLALSDLCGWDFAAKVDKLFQDRKKALHLTAAQEKDIRSKVAMARNATFGHISADGQARLRVDVCKPEQRTRLDGILAGISFD